MVKLHDPFKITGKDIASAFSAPPTPKKPKLDGRVLPSDNPFLMSEDDEPLPEWGTIVDVVNVGEDVLQNTFLAAAAKRFHAHKALRPAEGYRARRLSINSNLNQLVTRATEDIATAHPSLHPWPRVESSRKESHRGRRDRRLQPTIR